MLAEQPCQVVCAGAGFHANQARRQLRDQRQQLLPHYFWLDQHGLAAIIYAMHGKHVLGEFDSFGDNAHDFPLLLV